MDKGVATYSVFNLVNLSQKLSPDPTEGQTIATVGEGRKMLVYVRVRSKSQMFAKRLPTVFVIFLVARKLPTRQEKCSPISGEHRRP